MSEAEKESAVPDTPDHTPDAANETTTAEVDIETTETLEESTDSTETESVEAEIAESVTESEAEEDVVLTDDETTPTDEYIDKLRIKPEDKGLLKKTAAQNRELTTKHERIGGDFGIDTFEPFVAVLQKANATDEELAKVAEKLVNANGTVTMQFLTGGAEMILSNPQLGDPLLKTLFGDNASISNIKKLLALDKAEFFDREDAEEYLRSDVTGSNAYQNLLTRVEQAERRANEAEDVLKDPAKLQLAQQGQVGLNGRGSKAYEAFKSDFVAETPKTLEPAFKQVHWSGDGAHARLVTELLHFRLQNDSRFTETAKYLRQTGIYIDGDSRVGMANANLAVLKNLFNGQGRELIRELQKDFRKISEDSRNAKIVKDKVEKQVKEKTETTTTQTAPVKPQSHEERQAEIDRKYKERMAGLQEAQSKASV